MPQSARPAAEAAAAGTPPAALLRLAALVRLEQRARQTPAAELAFMIVNETHALLPYHQALLFDRERHIVAASGVARPDPQSPYLLWLTQVLRALPASPEATQPLDASQLPGTLAADWSRWLPAHVLWLPLRRAPDEDYGGLLLSRAEPWGEADRQLLALLAESYAASLALAARAPRRQRRLPRRRLLYWLGGLLALGLIGAWPTRQSVLAPAEVVPRTPALVRAPVEGVVASFQIEPNQTVSADQPLLRFDDTQVRSKLDVASRARDVAQAEYLTAAQQAFTDAKAKARLAELQSRVEQQAAERDYYAGLLERLQVRAPQAGVAIFDDANDWLGRPLSIGQKIMVIARPDDVELDVHLPANDPLALGSGAEALFFPNIAPERPLAARVRLVGYSASTGPDGIAAYRIKASFDAGATLRPGLRGTARLYGEPTPLALWLLRRPLANLARWLSL